MMTSAPESISNREVAENAILPPCRVRHLDTLVECGYRFPTVYADPPWDANRVARGAASRHYKRMLLDDSGKFPIEKLTTDNAHLHLWTTNGFLKEGFQVIEANPAKLLPIIEKHYSSLSCLV